MTGFWHRLAQHNAPFISHSLRALADEVEALAPGPAVVGLPVVFYGKDGITVGSIVKKDSDPAFNASVTFLDAKGSPTEPDDVPAWASDDDTIVSVSAAADGLSAVLTPGSPGAATAATAQITVTSTDTDGNVVTSVGAVTITSGEAAVGDVEFSG